MNKKKKLNIAIVGDCSNWNQKNISKENIDSNIRKKIKSSDIFIFNLEGPVVKKNIQPKSPIQNLFLRFLLKKLGKLQPVVTSSKEILDCLNLSKNNIACLANNHIKDAGESGLKYTLEILNKKGFKYLGAGINKKDASKPLIIQLKDYKIGILNYNLVGWNKFGLFFNIFGAEEDDFGANYQTKRIIRAQNKKLKEDTDFIINIFHTGKELKESVSESFLEFCRTLSSDINCFVHSHFAENLSGEQNFSLGDFIFKRTGNLPENRPGKIIYIELPHKKIVVQDYQVKNGLPILNE